MRGRGGGQKGRGGNPGRRGAKKGQDDYDWRSDQGLETEAKAPIAGGYKSMKSRWLKEFEREQKEREDAERAAKPAGAEQPGAGVRETAAAQKDGPLASRPSAQEKDAGAEGEAHDNKPAAHGVQLTDHAAASQLKPKLLPPTRTVQQVPAAVPGSDLAEAAERELALDAEANAAAELADSASEGERGIGGNSLMDVVVDFPAAHPAPDTKHKGDLSGPPIPEFAQKALSQAAAAEHSGHSKRKKAADKGQPEQHRAAAKPLQESHARYAVDADTLHRGCEASSREQGTLEQGGSKGNEAHVRPAAHDDTSGAHEQRSRKRDGGDLKTQKKAKQKGRAAEGTAQPPREPPDEKPAVAANAVQAAAVKREEQREDVEMPYVRDSTAEGSGAGVLAAVEYLGDGCTRGQQLGEVNLAKYDSYMALWNGLQQAYGKSLPDRNGLKLVYQDSDGDFILLRPDEPWAHFLSHARRVIISCR